MFATLGNMFGSMTGQMQLGLVVLVAIALSVGVLTHNLIRASARERMVAIITQKRQGMRERAASAIIDTERKIRKHGERGRKRPFEFVNPWAINRDLRRAGLPAAWPLVHLAAFVLAVVVGRFLINAPIYPLGTQIAALYLPMYFFCRKSVLGMLIDGRKMKSLEQLIVFIETVQRAVAVGAPADEAVVEAIRETPKPLRDMLEPVRELLNLGYEFVDAIRMAAAQVDLPEFDIFAASLAAQASSGGSIGGVLKDVTEIARARADLRKKVAVMTGEGRFNAILLGSLPIGLTQYLRVVQPEYFDSLWTSGMLGPALFFATFALAVTGALLAMRIARVSV